MLMKLPPETEVVTTDDDRSRCETFGPSDIEYIGAMIDAYQAGETPDDYEDAERFREDCESGFWIEETENGYEARVRIEYLTRAEFDRDPQLAIDIVWDDLVRWMYCHVLGVHYLEVIGDWRPDKLEYLRAVIADEVAKGHTIVYIDWPDGIEKPVAGQTMNEFISERGKVMDKANDQQRGRGFGGYLTNFELIAGDAKKKEKTPRTLTEILSEIKKAFGGYPYRVGEMLFVPDGGSGDTWGVHYLSNVDSLFSWFQRFGRVEWDKGVGFVTPQQLFEELRRSAPSYDTIESVPHEPPIPRAYYSCEIPRDGDGSALEGLLDRFSPASEQDRQLIKSLFLTAFWGGPPGARPAFLVTTPFGRGVGKSTLHKMLVHLVGGMFDIKPRENIEKIKERLLTPTARKLRLAVLDNLKSHRFSWDDLESLITTSVISGKQLYFGEGQRPNYLTWILTVNGASLTTDMAQRVVTIELDKPKHTGAWESDTERYMDEHRQEIIADILTVLRARPQGLAKATRWGTWESQVLARLDDPETLQRVIKERQVGSDVEAEEAGLIHEAIVSELWRHSINPHDAKVLIPSRILAEWIGNALAEKFTTGSSTQRLKQMIAEGTLRNLEYSRSHKIARGFVWAGDEAGDRSVETLASAGRAKCPPGDTTGDTSETNEQ